MKKVLSLIAAFGIIASVQAQTVTNPPTPDSAAPKAVSPAVL